MILLATDLFHCYLCSVRFLTKSCTKDFITFLKLMMYYIHCNLVSDASILHNVDPIFELQKKILKLLPLKR